MEHKTHTDTDSYTPKCKELTKKKKKKKHDLDKKYNMGKKIFSLLLPKYYLYVNLEFEYTNKQESVLLGDIFSNLYILMDTV